MSLRILLIDEDVETRSAFAHAADGTPNVHVETVASVSAALTTMDRGGRYDLVVCELVGRTGSIRIENAAFVVKLAAQGQGVVVVSSSPREAVIAIGGATPVLRKPVSFDHVLALADRAHDGRITEPPSIPFEAISRAESGVMPTVAASGPLRGWLEQLDRAEMLFVRGDIVAALLIAREVGLEADAERLRHALGSVERRECMNIVAKARDAQDRFERSTRIA